MKVSQLCYEYGCEESILVVLPYFNYEVRMSVTLQQTKVCVKERR